MGTVQKLEKRAMPEVTCSQCNKAGTQVWSSENASAKLASGSLQHCIPSMHICTIEANKIQITHTVGKRV